MSIAIYNANKEFKKYARNLQQLKMSYNNEKRQDDANVLNLHLESESLPLKSDFTDLSLCYVFHKKGCGRVAIEVLASDPSIAIITYAVMNKDQRMKGNMKDILNFARHYFEKLGVLVCIVQLNPLDSDKPWFTLGFDEIVMLGSNQELRGLLSRKYLEMVASN